MYRPLLNRLVSGAAVFVAITTSANAQDEKKPAPEYIGLGQCVLCHNQKLAADDSPFVTLSRDFTALTETEVFAHDKHRQAYELLEGELGQHMQKILADAWDKPDYKVTQDQACLSCHAGWKTGEEKPPTFEYGVTCESCHGPGSQWRDPHIDPKWRATHPSEKLSWGFTDVRNPLSKAKLCFSCHIGNVQEGKLVTHEMYAAGHPPLPGIELETFASQMPVHWRTLQEKGDFTHRDAWIKANHEGVEHNPLEDLPLTKSVMISGVMALRETLNMFGSQAHRADGEHWPELAVFDCSACHHDLAAPAWRQVRGYGTTVPGRPQIFAWATALVKVGVRHRAGSDDAKFQADWDAAHGKLEELRRVLDRRPFGIPHEIHAITHGENGLIAWLDELAEDLFKSPVGKGAARRALKTLATQPDDAYPDFNSARQVLWAIRAIQMELNSDPPEFATAPDGETSKQSVERAVANLKTFNAWRDGKRATGQKKVDELLMKLEFTTQLRLMLPAGDEFVIAEQLPQSLQAIAVYDPEWFREQLAALAKSLED
jgi:mono/diheme cytochrome c family protein